MIDAKKASLLIVVGIGLVFCVSVCDISPLRDSARARSGEPAADGGAFATAIMYTKSGANVRTEPSLSAGVAAQVPAGKPVSVWKENKVSADGHEWVEVKVQGIKGWMSRGLLQTSAEKKTREKEAAEAAAAARRAEWLQTPAGRICAANPGWKKRACDAVAANKIYIGMTQEMVRRSWGSPRDINRTINAYGRREQWVYGSFENRSYVYLDDGVVTTIQN